MLRLTSGIFRGRLIQAPPGLKTRPTQSRLRQALFNSIQLELPEARVLDLFSGSGALGFEALSRGANSVIFVESGRAAQKVIQKNARDLEVEDRIQILEDSVDGVTKKLGSFTPFDLVLADPPYEGDWEMKLLTQFPWNEVLRLDGVFCLEWGLKKSVVSELPDQVPFLVKIREKNYGDSILTTYRRVPGEAT